MTSTKKLRARAEKGYALLEAKTIGWQDRVNLDRLMMSTSGDCILSQVMEKPWIQAKVDIGIWPSQDNIEASKYGFCAAPDEDHTAVYDKLNEIWRELVLRKRASIQPSSEPFDTVQVHLTPEETERDFHDNLILHNLTLNGEDYIGSWEAVNQIAAHFLSTVTPGDIEITVN